jgi:hypothetical protein
VRRSGSTGRWTMADQHTPGLKRRYTNAEMKTWTVTELMDLAHECAVEPADPTNCDACAAYLIAQEQDPERFPLAAHFVLGATDADAQHPMVTRTGRVLTDADIQALADEAEAGYDVSKLKPREDWMARAMVAEAAVSLLLPVIAAARTLIDAGEVITDMECMYCQMTWPSAARWAEHVHGADCPWFALKQAVDAL